MDLSQVATGQYGVLTRVQALTQLSEAALRWRLERGDWFRVHPGIYQVHNGQLDWFGRASAALLCYGDGVALALESAAFVLGIESKLPALVQVDVPTWVRRERRTEAERGRDIRRDRSTAAAGRITLRCDWVDVCYEPCALAADLHATVSRRGFRGPLLACAPGCPAPGLVRRAS